jgi:hypothetical protein
MAISNLKRKSQLSKFESYKAANSKEEVYFCLKFCVVLLAHRYIPGC